MAWYDTAGQFERLLGGSHLGRLKTIRDQLIDKLKAVRPGGLQDSIRIIESVSTPYALCIDREVWFQFQPWWDTIRAFVSALDNDYLQTQERLLKALKADTQSSEHERKLGKAEDAFQKAKQALRLCNGLLDDLGYDSAGNLSPKTE